jgi:hypothetical protein
VPAESERLRHRLGSRDRLFLGLAAIGTVAGIVIAFLISHPGSNAGCVLYNHPNFTGGATYRYCGPKAAAFCRRAGPGDAGIAAQCGRLGLAIRP